MIAIQQIHFNKYQMAENHITKQLIFCPCSDHLIGPIVLPDVIIKHNSKYKSHNDYYLEELNIRGQQHYSRYYTLCADNEAQYQPYSEYYKEHSPECANILAREKIWNKYRREN